MNRSPTAAAFAGWPLLARWPDSPWRAPIGAGISMALVAHAVVAAAMVAVMLIDAGPAGIDGEALEYMLLLALFAQLFVAWVTVPLAIAVASQIHRLRRDARRLAVSVSP